MTDFNQNLKFPASTENDFYNLDLANIWNVLNNGLINPTPKFVSTKNLLFSNIDDQNIIIDNIFNQFDLPVNSKPYEISIISINTQFSTVTANDLVYLFLQITDGGGGLKTHKIGGLHGLTSGFLSYDLFTSVGTFQNAPNRMLNAASGIKFNLINNSDVHSLKINCPLTSIFATDLSNAAITLREL